MNLRIWNKLQSRYDASTRRGRRGGKAGGGGRLSVERAGQRANHRAVSTKRVLVGCRIVFMRMQALARWSSFKSILVPSDLGARPFCSDKFRRALFSSVSCRRPASLTHPLKFSQKCQSENSITTSNKIT
jgi:hypothetical protein